MIFFGPLEDWMEAIELDGSRDSERVTQQRTEGGDVVKEVAQLIHVQSFFYT